MKPFSLCVAYCSLLACSVTAPAGDWIRFRGPNGTGISEDAAPLPVKWGPEENLKWKIALPGPGSSSPIVVGEKVFITCWSGYGTDRGNTGSQENLKRHLICLDRGNGTILWTVTVDAVLPEDRYGGMFAQHGYASHTPVSDGERVYVFFGKTGALAFDLEGNKLWQTGVGTESDRRGWGSAASPVLHKDVLIVTASAESEALVGLNKLTGEEVWRQEARGFSSTWGTPVLVPVNDERTDLVIGVPNEIWGFNPETGKLLWYCDALSNDSFCSSVVAADGVIYAIEGRGGGSIAVRAGGTGDVTRTHVVWRGRDNGRINTPIVHEGRIYLISGRVATCIDAETGERIYQSRLTGGGTPGSEPPARGQAPGRGGFGGAGGRGGAGGGQDYSSPILADGKLFFATRSGEIHVMQPGPQFVSLAVNRVTTEEEDFSATPAVSKGSLLIRSDKFLYCIAQD